MPTLILTPRALVDADLLAQAAAAAGWEVVRLSSWRVPIDMNPEQPVIYGEPLFAEIVAAALDLALIQAPADWLAHVPAHSTQMEAGQYLVASWPRPPCF